MPARAIVLSSCSAWINMKAELADQNAKIDYLAMMADIEFPEAGDSATSTEESEEE